MRHGLLLTLFLFISFAVQSQQDDAVSLNDSLKVIQFLEEAKTIAGSRPTEAFNALQQAELLAQSSPYLKAGVKNIYGILYWQQAEYVEALRCYKEAEQYYSQLQDSLHLSKVWLNIGLVHANQKNFDKASTYYQQALNFIQYHSQQYPQEYTSLLSNIGVLSMHMGELEKSDSVHTMALKVAQHINHEESIARAYQNLGNLHSKQNNIALAESYFLKSLVISEKAALLHGQVFTNNSLASLYFKQNMLQKALIHAQKAYQLAKELGRKNSIKNALENLVAINTSLQDYKTALLYSKEYSIIKDSLFNEHKLEEQAKLEFKYNMEQAKLENDNLKKLNDLQEATIIRQRITTASIVFILLIIIILSILLYRRRQQVKRDNKILKEQSRLIQEQSKKLELVSSHKLRSILDSSLDACVGTDASGNVVIWSKTATSIFGWSEEEVIGKSLTDLFIPPQHHQAHQNGMSRYLNAREPNILNQRIEISAIRKNKEEFPVELTVTSVETEDDVLFTAFIRDITKQKADAEALRISQEETIQAIKANKKLIEEQNKLLEQKVQERTQKLQTAFEIIAQKNEDIASSLTYAAHIQQAILPSSEFLHKLFPEHFIFFRPKDIVSGDFYWAHSIGDLSFIVVADCTGHGVPGAFMSMIGNNLLFDIISKQKITRPDGILSELHKGIRKSLQQEHSHNRDGMDITICVINRKQKEVLFAGAKNSLIYFQNDQLFQLKGDKYSIGGEQLEENRIYAYQQLTYQGSMMLYMFSDGYQDQFGGTHNKKFMSKNLKKLFEQIYTLPVEEQSKQIQEIFEDWKGNEEQVDDVLVMGILVN